MNDHNPSHYYSEPTQTAAILPAAWVDSVISALRAILLFLRNPLRDLRRRAAIWQLRRTASDYLTAENDLRWAGASAFSCIALYCAGERSVPRRLHRLLDTFRNEARAFCDESFAACFYSRLFEFHPDSENNDLSSDRNGLTPEESYTARVIALELAALLLEEGESVESMDLWTPRERRRRELDEIASRSNRRPSWSVRDGFVIALGATFMMLYLRWDAPLPLRLLTESVAGALVVPWWELTLLSAMTVLWACVCSSMAMLSAIVVAVLLALAAHKLRELFRARGSQLLGYFWDSGARTITPQALRIGLLAVVLGIGALLLTGCDTGAHNYKLVPEDQVRITPDGFRYRIIVIEGRRFVATQGSNGYWGLAGPLDK